jgi:hypothetical protein
MSSHGNAEGEEVLSHGSFKTQDDMMSAYERERTYKSQMSREIIERTGVGIQTS